MRYLLITLIFVIFTGCSFKSPHTHFINDMSTYMTDYYDYEKEKEGDRRIGDENLVSKTYDHNGNTLYHFEVVRGVYGIDKCPCRYYIVVDKQGMINGWGFDPCDRKECCVILG